MQGSVGARKKGAEEEKGGKRTESALMCRREGGWCFIDGWQVAGAAKAARDGAKPKRGQLRGRYTQKGRRVAIYGRRSKAAEERFNEGRFRRPPNRHNNNGVKY